LIIILLVGIWAVATGILEVAAAISLREFIENEWLLGLSGLVSILFGIVLFFYPLCGVAVIWVIGAYTVLFEVLLILWASRSGNSNPRFSPAVFSGR
jgi:uncharacterized membrane protein HdeD (DUF308 family)